MATSAQTAANQANSQKSSGPATDAGKARSSLNRLSHGFASSTCRLIPGENPEEFKALLADFMEEYQPATPTEQVLIEHMVQNQWLSLRSFRLQNVAFTQSHQTQKPVDANLSLLIRYQTAADRAFHKDHMELVKAQKERKKSEIGFGPQKVEVAVATPSAPLKTEPKIAPPTIEAINPVAPQPVDHPEIVPPTPNVEATLLKNAA